MATRSSVKEVSEQKQRIFSNRAQATKHSFPSGEGLTAAQRDF